MSTSILTPEMIGARPKPTVSAAALERKETQALYWVVAFVLLQFACQLALLVDAMGNIRVVLRSAAFLTSMLFIVIVPGREHRYQPKVWIVWVLILMALEVGHPLTVSTFAGTAHTVLYVSVVAAVFWVTRLRVGESGLRAVILILWGFHTLSATLGVIQTHYPGRFQPRVSTAITKLGVYSQAYVIELANGEKVWRPMGLTDMPGGASAAGLYAFVFGLGIFLQYRSAGYRLFATFSMLMGLFCLYVGHGRSLMVMSAICAAAILYVLARRGELMRHADVLMVLGGVTSLAFVWAATIGGRSAVERIDSLTTGNVVETVHKSRFHFLVTTVEEIIPKYPLGAGLARYGMVNSYFGRDPVDPASTPLYAEIQITCWAYDGGIPMIILYGAAIISVTVISHRIAMSRVRGPMPYWGAMLFALNLASIAVTFNNPLFMGQSGVEFWFLNACLYMAAVTEASRRRLAATPA